MKPRFLRPLVSVLFVSLSSAALMTEKASATDWYWDADGDTTTATGGTGNWTQAGVLWRNASATGTLTAYNNAAGPQSDTAANLVLVGVDAGVMTLSATTAYNLNKITANNSHTFATNTGVPTFVGTTPTVTVASGKSLVWGTDLSAASATVTKSGAGTWQWNNSTGQVTSNTTTLDITAGTLQFNTSGTGANLFTGTGGVVKVGSTGTLSTLQSWAGSYVASKNYTLGSKVILNGGTFAVAGGSTGALFVRLTSGTALQVDAASTISQTNGSFAQDFTIEGAVTGTGTLAINRAAATFNRYLNLKGSMSGYSGNVTIGASTATGYVLFGHSSGWGSGTLTLTGSGSRVTIGDEVATDYNTGWTGGSTLGYTSGTFAPAGIITLGASSELSLMNSTASYGILFSPTTGITLNGGTLSAKGTSGTSAYVPATGSTWTVGGTASSTISGNLQFNNIGVIFDIADAATGSDLFVTGTATGTAGFTKKSAGALAFNGTTSISGLVTIDAGVIQLSAATAKSLTGGLAGTGTLNLGGTGLVTLSGVSTSFTGSINVADGAALGGEANTNGTLTLGGTTGASLWPDFSTPGGFTANNIVLNGTNTIRFLTPPAAGAYTLLKYNGALSGTGSFSANFRGASVNNTGGAGGNEIVLTIGTPVSLIWNNAAANLTWNGGISANWLNGAANDVFYDADTVVFNDTPGSDQAIVVSGVVSPGGITFPISNDTVNYSFTGALAGDGISGPTSLVKSGDATLTLGMANTYSGGTTLNEGRLRVGNDTALGSATVTINGGALATDGATSRALANPILLTGSPTLGSAGDTGVLTLSGAVTLSGGARTLATASDAVISGAIGGAFGLTKSGSGILTLTNTNTHASTTVDGGVLQVGSGGAAGAIPATATITSPGTLRYFRSENGVTLANTFSGDGTLAFKGTGTKDQSSYSLTGTNTGLTGTLEIGNGARVVSTTAAQLGSAANVNIASGGQLYLNGGTYANTFNIAGSGWTETAGQLGALRVNGTITGPVALTAAARITPYSGSGTISGPLTGTADLEINATTSTSFTGTLNYSGNGSLFTGATTVSQGTLNLTGNLGGNLAVSSTSYAATLNGEGSVAGTLTLGAVGKGANLATNPNTAGAFTSAGAFTPAEAGTVVAVNFSPAPDAVGTYTVLNYASTTAVPTNFSLPGYRTAVFDTTTSGTATTVTVTATALTWKGTTAVWDVATADNWKSATVDPEKFYHLDSVTFDETGGSFNPTLAVTVAPASVTFTNPATDYTLTGTGVIAGAATLTKGGVKSLTLSTPNTYTGTTTINAGTLKVGNATALGSAAGGTTINPTGTLDLNALNLGAEPITLAGGAIINSSATAQQQAFTNLTATANSSIGGTGRWDVRGATAVTTVDPGVTLTKVDTNQVYLSVVTGSQVINNGLIQVNAGTLAIWQSTITGTGTFTVNPTGSLAIETAVDNPQAVTLAGGTLGNLTGTAASTQSGPVTLTANSTISGFSTAGAFNLTGGIGETGGAYGVTIPANGGTINFNGATTFTGGLSVGPTGAASATTVTLSAASSLNVIAGKEIRIANNIASGTTIQTLNVDGAVTNAGSLYLGRPAVLNMRSGATWSQSGAMSVNGHGGYTSAMNVTAGASFTYSGATTIKLNGASGNSGRAHLTIADTGVFTTSAGFEQTTSPVPTSGFGRVTLSGGGTIKLTANVANLTTQSQFVLGTGGGVIDTNGFDTSLSGEVTVGTGTIDPVVASGGALSAGIIGAGNGLTKKSGGKLTLTGTNGYTGATMLDGGTLGGTGAAGSVLTAASGTFLAPGASIGTFLSAGATLLPGATLAMEINSTTDTADKLVSTAAVDITGAAVTFAEIGAGIIPAGTKLVLIDYTGTTLAGTFSGYAEGDPVSVGANTFTLSYADSSKVTLTSTTVSGYASWASTKDLTVLNNGMGQNPDNDGMDNLLEYVLGGDPLVSDPAILPGAVLSGTNLIFTYHRSDDSETDTTQIIEYGNNLIGWTPVTVPAASATVSGLGFAIDEGSPTTAPDTVVITIPTGGAPGFFARLKVTNP